MEILQLPTIKSSCHSGPYGTRLIPTGNWQLSTVKWNIASSLPNLPCRAQRQCQPSTDSLLTLLNYYLRVRVTLLLAIYRQSVRLGAKPLRPTTSIFFNWTLAVIVLCKILFGQRMCLSFTIPAGLRQRSHSRVRIPRDSWPYFTV
jgi:hypothetical protein